MTVATTTRVTSSAMLIDLSRPLAATTAAWPGDVATSLAPAQRMAEGATVNVSTLACSLHAATHVDAPWHYDDAAATMDDVDPNLFLGAARVVDARGADPVTPDLLADVDVKRTPRVLLRTDGWPDSAKFPRDFPTLSEAAVARLAGAVLIGVDVPSVDKSDSKTLPIHHALRRADILILEGLDLSAVEAGVYELIALPLKIIGGDASPIRAMLRRA